MNSEHDRSAGQAPSRALFLVELRTAVGAPTDLDRMHHDLSSAIARLRSGGVDIDRAGSYVLPDDARCLCLLHAHDKATAEFACDAAGLTAVPVHVAHRFPDPPFGHGPHDERAGTP